LAEYRLPYGKTHLTFTLPEGPQVGGPAVLLLSPRPVAGAADETAAVSDALDLVALPPIVHGRKEGRAARCAIAINDKTRPVPHKHLLPPLLARLEALGFAPREITLVIATGTHQPMRPEEFPAVVPEHLLGRYTVVSHDAEDRANLVHLGETSAGTPVWANRLFAEADLRIVVGDIEPHQFAGFSGGVKSAAIGLAGRLTIDANHAMMFDPRSQIGRYEDNPCRQDVEEIGRIMGVHYALNAVLNEERQIVNVLAGDPVAVMKAGIAIVRKIFLVEVPEPFDLMIVSPGGHPKDINLYQAQKALGHAALVMKPDGAVIVAAACPEGTGSRGYEAWMADPAMTSYEAVIERFRREGFHIGPHKAFQIARDARGPGADARGPGADASRTRLVWVSEMAPDFARRLLLNPPACPPDASAEERLKEALSEALAELRPRARIGIMPWANATIPALQPSTAAGW